MDLGWKHALGLPLDHPGFHPTTFSVFRSRILLHDADEELLRRVVARAVAAGILPRRSLQLIDSSAVLGAGAVLDTYELLRRGIAQLVGAAGERTLSKALRRKLARYLKATKPSIDWQSSAARRAELGRMVQVADRLLPATAGRGRAGRGSRTAGSAGRPGRRPHAARWWWSAVRQQVTRDRIVSTRDPDMRHGRKSSARRFDGYKVHLTQEPGSELLTAVAVTKANAADGAVAADLVAQAKANGAGVGELVGDMAYGGGEVRAQVAAAGARMVAKVPPYPATGRFGKAAFTLDLSDPARPNATCPAGVTTRDLRRSGCDHHGRPRHALFFAASACGPCQLRARCVDGTRSRTVLLHHHERLLQPARAAQTNPRVRRKLRRRPIIERKVDHLKDRGLGQARWLGERKVLLQARLTATLVNVERLFVLDGYNLQAGRQAA